MSRTLEDLIKDCIAIQTNRNEIQEQDIDSWTCRISRSKERRMGETDLPFEIMQGLRLPLELADIFRHLHELYRKNRHEPFFRLYNGTVLYLAPENSGTMRIYIGERGTLRVRGDGASARFEIKQVYDCLHLMGADMEEYKIRKQSPQDFLTPPEKAQGGKVVPVIQFSISSDAMIHSTHNVDTEYRSLRNTQAKQHSSDDVEEAV